MKNYISQTKFTNYENDKDLLTLGTQSVQIEDVDITEGSIGTFSGDLNMVTPGSKVKLTSPDGLTQSSLELDNTGSLTQNGESIGGGGGFEPTSVSGATHSLDLSNFNFFDAGELTEDTTVEFVNPPQEAKFQYSFVYKTKPFNIQSPEQNTSIITRAPMDVTFNNDGTKLYILKGSGGDKLLEFVLSTPFDITTFSQTNTLFVQNQDNRSRSMYFRPDGTELFYSGGTNKKIYKYVLSSPYDISTATFTDELSVSNLNNQRGLDFKPDGSKMFLTDDSLDKIYQYDLSVNFDITTASLVKETSLTSFGLNQPTGFQFLLNGTELVITDNQDNKIYKFTTNQPYDIDTLTKVNEFQLNDSINFYNIEFTPDGQSFVIPNIRGEEGDIIKFNTTENQINLPTGITNPPYIEKNVGSINTFEFFTNDGGTTYNYVEPKLELLKPGLVNDTGVDSIRSAVNLTSSPARALGDCSISLGNGACSTRSNNITLGANSVTKNINSITIGDNNFNNANRTILIRPGGGTDTAFRGNSVSIGYDTYPGAGGTQIGCGARGLQNMPNTSVGRNSITSRDGSALGADTCAMELGSVALGRNSKATANCSVAIGGDVQATKPETTTTRELELCKSGGGLTLTTPDGTNQSKLTIDNSQSLLLDGNSIGGGGSAGLVSGSGTDSIRSSDALTTTPAQAIGNCSIAFGSNARACANNSVTIGVNAETGTSFHSVAIGSNAKAGNSSVAIGVRTNQNCIEDKIVSIGNEAESREFGVTIGRLSCGQQRSITIGPGNQSDGSAVNIGTGNEACFESVTIGKDSYTRSDNSVAIGQSARVTQRNGIAIGQGTSARGQCNINIGRDNGGGAGYDFANCRIGLGNFSSVGACTILIGHDSTTPSSDQDYIVIGNTSTANCIGSIALGNNVTASKTNTVTVKALETCVAGEGVIMTTPDGTSQYKLTIDNTGQIQTTLV